MKGNRVKRTKESSKNRILAWIAAGCMLFTGVLCVAGVSVLHEQETEDESQAADAVMEQAVPEQDVEAVLAEKNMLGNSFSGTSGDGKKAIRIVEVIPHPIFSVFPYMVDWKTVKGYDENTYLGYEGLRYFITQTTQSVGNNNVYSLTKDGLIKDTLDDYNVTFIKKENWQIQAGWWRETKMDENILHVNGYFEYVGNNQGLYHINLEELVEEGSSELGIRYGIMAMERTGTQEKQGEWEVKDPQYYWAKDYAEKTTYPNTGNGEIRQKTGYNYDLKFQAGAADGKSAQYHIKTIAVMTEDIEQLKGYEYAAVLAEGIEWTGGYRYSNNGNYTVKSYTPYVVNDTTDLTGKYIRVSSDSKKDASGLQDGYFRLCTAQDHITNGDTVYSVVFAKAAVGKKGDYILNPAAVQSAISSNSAKAFTEILFEYVGEIKGNYDISFIYGPDDTSGALYSYTLLKVSDGNGRYALTSTEEEEDQLYKEVGDHAGDYSKVVTSIDCAGIDYTKFMKDHGTYVETWDTEGYYDAKLSGLTVGRDMYDETKGHGNWVFHTVSSDEANGITKIRELEGGTVPKNKRIYVYDQNRKNCYYAQNGFDNNEWFKLLLYLSTENGSMPLAYSDYANGILTPHQIKEKYAADIEAFDRAYRIEIIQKTPGQLTVEDVEKADLLYFAGGTERCGLTGMSIATWNKLISSCHLSLPAADKENIKYTDDLSAEVLMAIYDNCLYERTTSLLFSGEDMVGYARDFNEVVSNLGKMGMLTNFFDDPVSFAYFLDGYEEKNPDYTTIYADGDVSAFWQQIPGIGVLYNLGTMPMESVAGQNITGEAVGPTDTWKKEYFRVVDLVTNENGLYEVHSDYLSGDGKYGYNWSSHSWWKFRGADVTEGDRTWYIPDSTADPFGGFGMARNVWQILHNKKSKESSEPVVVVTNADGNNISELDNVEPIYYYYVDGFAVGNGNTEFDVKFEINWRPEEIDEPNSLTSVVMTRSDGGTVFSLADPSYKTEYVCNVAGDFMKDGVLNSEMNSKEYEITATDSEGKTDKVIVRFIVRETFMLN